MNIDDALEQARNSPETTDWNAVTDCAKRALEAALGAADPGRAARAGELFEIIACDTSQPEPPPDRGAAILAACAYALAGDTASAARVIRENEVMSALLSNGELALLGIAVPESRDQVLRTLPRLVKHHGAVREHRNGNREGRDRILADVERHPRNPWERYLLNLAGRMPCPDREAEGEGRPG